MQKRNKKTIGKNVGHKDADNKVWGDREAALQNAGKVRWQVDKMAFDVDSSACINILNLRPFLARFHPFMMGNDLIIACFDHLKPRPSQLNLDQSKIQITRELENLRCPICFGRK